MPFCRPIRRYNFSDSLKKSTQQIEILLQNFGNSDIDISEKTINQYKSIINENNLLIQSIQKRKISEIDLVLAVETINTKIDIARLLLQLDLNKYRN